jgi:glyoxylase-like metal-dependent hydrolase (beta-lactamase superfamily II)
MRQSTTITAIFFVLCIAWLPSSFSQTIPVNILDRARVASIMIPGDLPLEVRFQGISKWSAPLSGYVKGATDDSAPWVIGVFQIRFPSGWIMVDAGASKEYMGSDGFSDGDYETVGEALARADMNILTHEHYDHAASLYRGVWADAAGQRAMLTVEQIDSILAATPDGLIIPASRDETDKFFAVSYEDLLPIAPGVVLVKAPGHTLGSQMVFVVLASGAEILLVGDVVWHKSQIETASQKGPISDGLGEDRRALTAQIEWLREVSETDTHVVIAHDLLALEAQFSEGVLTNGLYSTKHD